MTGVITTNYTTTLPKIHRIVLKVLNFEFIVSHVSTLYSLLLTNLTDK